MSKRYPVDITDGYDSDQSWASSDEDAEMVIHNTHAHTQKGREEDEEEEEEVFVSAVDTHSQTAKVDNLPAVAAAAAASPYSASASLSSSAIAAASSASSPGPSITSEHKRNAFNLDHLVEGGDILAGKVSSSTPTEGLSLVSDSFDQPNTPESATAPSSQPQVVPKPKPESIMWQPAVITAPNGGTAQAVSPHSPTYNTADGNVDVIARLAHNLARTQQQHQQHQQQQYENGAVEVEEESLVPRATSSSSPSNRAVSPSRRPRIASASAANRPLPQQISTTTAYAQPSSITLNQSTVSSSGRSTSHGGRTASEALAAVIGNEMDLAASLNHKQPPMSITRQSTDVLGQISIVEQSSAAGGKNRKSGLDISTLLGGLDSSLNSLSLELYSPPTSTSSLFVANKDVTTELPTVTTATITTADSAVVVPSTVDQPAVQNESNPRAEVASEPSDSSAEISTSEASSENEIEWSASQIQLPLAASADTPVTSPEVVSSHAAPAPRTDSPVNVESISPTSQRPYRPLPPSPMSIIPRNSSTSGSTASTIQSQQASEPEFTLSTPSQSVPPPPVVPLPRTPTAIARASPIIASTTATPSAAAHTSTATSPTIDSSPATVTAATTTATAATAAEPAQRSATPSLPTFSSAIPEPLNNYGLTDRATTLRKQSALRQQYPKFAEYSAELLEKLLRDEDLFDIYFDQMHDVQSARDVLAEWRSNNEYMCRQILSERDEISQLRSHIDAKLGMVERLTAKLQEKLKLQDAAIAPFTKRRLVEVLETSVYEAESAAESRLEQFTATASRGGGPDGAFNVDEFVKNYMDSRQRYHVMQSKLELVHSSDKSFYSALPELSSPSSAKR